MIHFQEIFCISWYSLDDIDVGALNLSIICLPEALSEYLESLLNKIAMFKSSFKVSKQF